MTKTEQEAADKAAAALAEARALADSNYADLPDAPEPMTMRVRATDPEQGEFVIINTVDFDPGTHVPYDTEAEKQVSRMLARRRIRLRKQLE